MDLTIHLPFAVLLKEVQIQPHSTSLTSKGTILMNSHAIRCKGEKIRWNKVNSNIHVLLKQ